MRDKLALDAETFQQPTLRRITFFRLRMLKGPSVPAHCVHIAACYHRNPTPQPVKSPFDDEPVTWEKFSMNDDLKVLDLDWIVSTQKNFRQQRNAFFYDYMAFLAPPIVSFSGTLRITILFNAFERVTS
jgi:hypothetical protein